MRFLLAAILVGIASAEAGQENTRKDGKPEYGDFSNVKGCSLNPSYHRENQYVVHPPAFRKAPRDFEGLPEGGYRKHCRFCKIENGILKCEICKKYATIGGFYPTMEPSSIKIALCKGGPIEVLLTKGRLVCAHSIAHKKDAPEGPYLKNCVACKTIEDGKTVRCLACYQLGQGVAIPDAAHANNCTLDFTDFMHETHLQCCKGERCDGKMEEHGTHSKPQDRESHTKPPVPHSEL